MPDTTGLIHHFLKQGVGEERRLLDRADLGFTIFAKIINKHAYEIKFTIVEGVNWRLR